MMDDPPAVALRFALYGVLGLLFGLLAFRHYVSACGFDGVVRRFAAALSVVGVLLSGFGLVELAARMHGLQISDTGLAEVETILSLPGLSSAFIVRLAALLIALALLLLGFQRDRIILFCAGVALISLAWQGHAGGTEGRTGLLHLVATVFHLLAAAIWLGALTTFAWMTISATRSGGDSSSLSLALVRFHGLGTLVVTALAGTGSVAFIVIAGWPLSETAFQSTWWWLLACKLLAFAAMLGLAAANRYWLAPDLVAGHQRALSRVRISIAVELALAFLILALVAWLGLLAPDPG